MLYIVRSVVQYRGGRGVDRTCLMFWYMVQCALMRK